LKGTKTPAQLLRARILSLAGVEKRKSRWGQGDAYWIGTHEFIHSHSQDRLDIRVGRETLKARPEIRSDSRLVLRPRASDWIEFRLRQQTDVNDAFELVKLAWKNGRSSGKKSPKIGEYPRHRTPLSSLSTEIRETSGKPNSKERKG